MRIHPRFLLPPTHSVLRRKEGAWANRETLAYQTTLCAQEDEGKDYGKDEGHKTYPRVGRDGETWSAATEGEARRRRFGRARALAYLADIDNFTCPYGFPGGDAG